MDASRDIKSFTLSKQNRFKDDNLQHVDDIPARRRTATGARIANAPAPYDVSVMAGTSCASRVIDMHVCRLLPSAGHGAA